MRWRVLVELSLLKRVCLGVEVCKRLIDFVVRCRVWFSQWRKMNIVSWSGSWIEVKVLGTVTIGRSLFGKKQGVSCAADASAKM